MPLTLEASSIATSSLPTSSSPAGGTPSTRLVSALQEFRGLGIEFVSLHEGVICRLLCEKNVEREGWLRPRDTPDMREQHQIDDGTLPDDGYPYR